MPTRPPKHIPAGHKPWEQTRKEHDQKRGTSAQRGYDSEWRKLRLQFLLAHPMCEGGCKRLATEVDHIRSVRDYPELRLSWANLRGYCKSCHSRVTLRHDGGYGNVRTKKPMD